MAVAAVPVGIALAEYRDVVTLTDAAPAIPVAFVLGLAAILMGTRARRRSDFTLGRVGGRAAGTAGRWLGALGVYLGLLAALSVGVYGLLKLFE